MGIRSVFRAAALLLASALALPAWADELRVPLPGRDDLVIDVPAGWHAQVRRPQAALPPTIALSGADASSFQVLITPSWPAGAATAPTANDVRALVQGAAGQARPRAVEAELPLKDLGASGKSGYYFSATDRQPEPGGFKHLTQGAVTVNELRVTFTVLVNGQAQPTTDLALELLRSMRRAAPRGST